MKIKKNSFRRTEISKVCAFVCTVGFAALTGQGAHAVGWNLFGEGAVASETYTTSTDSVSVFYNDSNSGNTGVNWNTGVNIVLDPGVNLTGQTSGLTGVTVPLAVFTNTTLNGAGDNVSFANNLSTLTLKGNNEITGIVGARFSGSGNVVADPLTTITVMTATNTFNREVHALNIELMSGSSVLFLEDIGGSLGTGGTVTSTVLKYLGSDSTVTFGAGVTMNGNITNTTNIANSTLVFNGTGTVTGSVGTSTTGIGTVQVKGVNSPSDSITSVVTVGGNLSTDHLQYLANTRVIVNGDLYLNVKTSNDALNVVSFGNTDGILEIGNNGDILGRTIAGVPRNTITTTQNNTGTVTMVSGTQSITGNVGQTGLSIKTLNIGGVGDVSSTTTVTGHVFASTVSLNNDAATPASSNLLMASGYNLTGNVVTDTNGMGTLTLLGGEQTVTGTVGTSNSSRLARVSSGAAGANSIFTREIFSVLVEGGYTGTPGVSTANGISTYRRDVSAQDVIVGGGTSNFEQSLTATGTTTIGAGTGNFNFVNNQPSTVIGDPTVDTSTTANILFNGVGTANLGQGLNGTINFGGQVINSGTPERRDSTVNLWNGETITGNISTTADSTGVLNARGSGILAGTVGAQDFSINTLAVNTGPNSVDRQSAGAALEARGDIYATTIRLENDGTLRLAANVDTTGNIVTTTTNTGTLTLMTGGPHTVSGNVGTSGAVLKQINVGLNTTDTFQYGTVYATTLQYGGNGAVQFNGGSLPNTLPAAFTGTTFNANAESLGFVGTVDFGTNVTSTGTFVLGDNVDLITENATGSSYNNMRTAFRDANGATLRFAGSSVVTGVLGSSTNALSQNFREIEAGVSGETVTFRNDVYVHSPTTFHVLGGTVNLLGTLNGSLNFDSGGIVNVAHDQAITLPVTTTTDNTGVLNYTGSASTRANIGTSTARLASVTFHGLGSDPIVPILASTSAITISHDIYAASTTIGNGTAIASGGSTVATIRGNRHLGTDLTLTNETTLNTVDAVSTYSQAQVDAGAISRVDFAHRKNADGTLTALDSNNTALSPSRSTVGATSVADTGVMTTAGATLNFAIVSSPWLNNAGGVLDTSSSSKISEYNAPNNANSTTLNMSASDRVNISLLGSLKHTNPAYAVIDLDSGGNATLPSAGNVLDNSYVIDTSLSRTGGDLLITASRGATTDLANNVYIIKSDTSGHFSNPAALRLGTLAAAGSDYGQDMQTALNMLDIDQWGYGNNQANLAVQAKRLAPIANNSIGLSMFRTSSMVSDNIGLRMHEMRISEQAQRFDDKGFWIRSMYQQGKQNALGAYDGFDSKISGFTMGIDARPNRESILGAALSYSNTKVEQRDFRSGDQATANTWHLSLYGAYDFTPELFVDGVVTASTGNLDSARATAVGRTAKADTDVNQITGKVNLGYRFKLPDTAITITPLLSYEGSTLRQDAYRESGAGDIGLSTPSQRLNWNRAGVGLRLATTTMWGGMVAKPELTVMAQNENGNFAKPITSQFIGDYTNTAFTTTVADKSAYSRSSVRGILGLNLLMSKSSSLSVRYDHTNGDDFKSNAFDLMARWNF